MSSKQNFLAHYVSLADGTEIPKEFAIWCGVFGISAALSRRVWVDLGIFKVYPNLYTVLVAGSGRCRKSTAVDQVHEILLGLEPRPNLISQRITPEALIDALSVQEFTGEGVEMAIERSAEGIVIVDELSTFLNKKTYEAGLASLLIPFFDCKPEFEYRTKGRGVERLEEVCLAMLAASTVDWIKDAIPIDAVGGGLTSRMIFIYVDEPAPPVAFPEVTEQQRESRESYRRFLQRCLGISGEFKLLPEAKKFYKEKYDEFYKGSSFFSVPTLSGYASRRHIHMLKLGMCLSLAMGEESLKIREEHLIAADNMLSLIEPNLPKVLNLIASTEKGNICESIYAKIASVKAVSKHELIQAFSHKIDSEELMRHLLTLQRSKRIILVVQNDTAYYAINPKV